MQFYYRTLVAYVHNLGANTYNIASEKTYWITYRNLNYSEVTVILLGTENLKASNSAATVIAGLQDLVNTVRSFVGSYRKIIMCALPPCKAYIGSGNYTAWQNVNIAIAGGGATPITGLDGYVNRHVAMLDDGAGNLAAAYNVSDGFNITTAGKQIIFDSIDIKLTQLGY
jgi:hypothetical protein